MYSLANPFSWHYSIPAYPIIQPEGGANLPYLPGTVEVFDADPPPLPVECWGLFGTREISATIMRSFALYHLATDAVIL